MSLQLVAILTAAAGMGLVALAHNAYAAYLMFSALVALVLVSYLGSRLSARALGWRRPETERVYENDPFTVTIELTNRGRLPHLALTVRDALPPFLHTDGTRDFILPALWPRQRITLSYTARARKRGAFPLGPLTVSTSDPFGLFQRTALLQASAESIVYPRPIPLRPESGRTALTSRADAVGESARAYESGLDFYGIRDYQPGDELRRIHWPATAHHGKLTVIDFDRGESPNLVVLLDVRRGTEFGIGIDTSLEVSVRAAASLIHWTLGSGGAAALALESAGSPRWLPLDRPDREHAALELLARVSADGEMAPSSLLAWAAERIAPGATVCLITAAPDEDLPAAVEALARRHVNTAVFVLDAHSFDSNARPPDQALRSLSATTAAAVRLPLGGDLRKALEDVLFAG